MGAYQKTLDSKSGRHRHSRSQGGIVEFFSNMMWKMMGLWLTWRIPTPNDLPVSAEAILLEKF